MNTFYSNVENNILLVEDTPEHIEVAAAILIQNNYKITVANKGITALKLLDNKKPDLILLDIYMPDMNGFELCKLIKENDNYSDIPIIFLTASGDEESIKTGFELGAQDYVVKPFNRAELLARVSTHLKLKHQNELIKEAYKELDSFCYTVSHDVKTPLFSIDKLIELMLLDYSRELNSEGSELLLNIKDKSEEVITMIDRLLDFSKMCNLEMKYSTIDLKKLFLDVYDELIKQYPERNVTYIVEELPTINGDPVMIRLLIQNIISNALKYTSKQELAVIEVTFRSTANEYIFSVKDNGVGFDSKYSSRLFGVFERLHTDNEYKGTGAGLAITQRILKRHNGQAWIEGEVNKGAIYHFSFPR